MHFIQEAERDSPKKWSPIVEMPFRGGFYRGRCEGGLPEGKVLLNSISGLCFLHCTEGMESQFMSEITQGRLVLGDGSIYDGIWHYGKRSGLGTFYFSNGDVFQGSWREDVMHGKVCLFLFKIKLISVLRDHLLGDRISSTSLLHIIFPLNQFFWSYLVSVSEFRNVNIGNVLEFD